MFCGAERFLLSCTETGILLRQVKVLPVSRSFHEDEGDILLAQTTFSQSRVPERGDTRGWTETPQQKLLRLSAAEQQRPQALEAAAPPQDSAAARAVDAYNQSRRPKTLVEEHQEKLKVCSSRSIAGSLPVRAVLLRVSLACSMMLWCCCACHGIFSGCRLLQTSPLFCCKGISF